MNKIPTGVAYSAEHDNFYGGDKGMGSIFHAHWKHLAHLFPEHDRASMIEDMTVEEFFEGIREVAKRDNHRGPGIEIFEDGDGGYCAKTRGSMTYGDTPGQAIRAAFDSYIGAPSKRNRLNPPYFESDRHLKNWHKAYRCKYDYRNVDWQVPDDDA
jgi:hypothetical protein